MGCYINCRCGSDCKSEVQKSMQGNYLTPKIVELQTKRCSKSTLPQYFREGRFSQSKLDKNKELCLHFDY